MAIPPNVTANTKVDVQDSCKCSCWCCFRQKKDPCMTETEIKVDEVTTTVLHKETKTRSRSDT